MIAFNKHYNKFITLSGFLILASLLLLFFKGLNFGIDFKGGTLIELRSTDSKINVSSLRDNFKQMELGDVSVKKFGNETDFLIKFENINNENNIIEDIKTFPKNIDLYAQEDENNICAGCMLLIPTQNTKNLLNQCDNYFKHNRNNIMGNSDQALINKLVKEIKIKYHLLPWQKYASGKQYFDKNKRNFFRFYINHIIHSK